MYFIPSGDNKPIWMQAEEREDNKVKNEPDYDVIKTVLKCYYTMYLKCKGKL